MIFFSSDTDFEIFYKKFTSEDLKIDLLVTESPKKQGRRMEIKYNPAHQFAIDNGLKVAAFERLDDQAAREIESFIGCDKLGFIFAYGKIIPKNIINLFENGILNIHFSLLPDYPGASPLQQAILEGKESTGYTIFEITEDLDQGKILFQEAVPIKHDDDFDSLRTRIIEQALGKLPELLKKYLKWEISLSEMPEIKSEFTHKINKSDGLIDNQDDARTAYNKIRAYSRWPKTYILAGDKRMIIHSATLEGDKLKIIKIQPEGKKIMSFEEFINGYGELLTKMPPFVKIN